MEEKFKLYDDILNTLVIYSHKNEEIAGEKIVEIEIGSKDDEFAIFAYKFFDQLYRQFVPISVNFKTEKFFDRFHYIKKYHFHTNAKKKNQEVIRIYPECFLYDFFTFIKFKEDMTWKELVYEINRAYFGVKE